MRYLLLCLPMCLALAACQASLAPLPAWQASEGRTHAQLGQIVDLTTGQVLAPEQLVQRLADAPRVLVGEKHDNPDHHALQLWLLRALKAAGRKAACCWRCCSPNSRLWWMGSRRRYRLIYPRRWPGRTAGTGRCMGR